MTKILSKVKNEPKRAIFHIIKTPAVRAVIFHIFDKMKVLRVPW